MMQYSFSYNKKKVIQALRYHFFARQEIKFMIILVNLYAILAAILFFLKKIRPEPFVLGSLIWLLMLIAVWYILPYSIYKRSIKTFTDQFIIRFTDDQIFLENERGEAHWKWADFAKYMESPHFFHLYFNAKSFFLIPKEGVEDENKKQIRELFKLHIPS
ncbi:YcxB family protein [Hydrotalea flava]|uniref:YcxB family protein n=1 Tax=Hydrotalea flava TaxID=714549 RepID=UPI0020A38F0F|nr:YcxB family protein [Hydrotalea flava]